MMQQLRLLFYSTMILPLWLHGTSCLGQPAATKQPINFVFFLVDDLGYMDIGANNPDCFYDTPNVDRLARSGMRFTSGYAACPVCSPTRLSSIPAPPPSTTL